MTEKRITPSLVISILALIVALGGVSYAAIKIPKNSVGTKQLKRNAVTTAKLRNNSVNSNKVRNGTLRAGDFAAGVLPGATWQAKRPSEPVLLNLEAGDLQTIVSTPELPAGSYVLTARANVVNGPTAATILCSLESDAAQGITLASGSVLPLSMNATAILQEPGPIGLKCNKSSGTPSIAQAHVIATRVPSVVRTPEDAE